MSEYSQNQEELYIKYILTKIGTKNKFCVELGAGDGFYLSNTRYFIKRGYSCIQIDKNGDNQNVYQENITAENICSLLKKYECPKEFDFLSIDLDGNDYWIIKELCKEYSPRLIVFEFNGVFPIEICKTIKYNPNHIHNDDDYYGFTFGAAIKLSKEIGYNIVFQNNNLNGYMVRKDIKFEPMIHEFVPKKSTYNSEGEWVSV